MDFPPVVKRMEGGRPQATRNVTIIHTVSFTKSANYCQHVTKIRFSLFGPHTCLLRLLDAVDLSAERSTRVELASWLTRY